MKRLDCLSVLGPLIKDDDLVVTTLGWVAGEWFAVRHKESNFTRSIWECARRFAWALRWCYRIAAW